MLSGSTAELEHTSISTSNFDVNIRNRPFSVAILLKQRFLVHIFAITRACQKRLRQTPPDRAIVSVGRILHLTLPTYSFCTGQTCWTVGVLHRSKQSTEPLEHAFLPYCFGVSGASAMYPWSGNSTGSEVFAISKRSEGGTSWYCG